MNMHYSMTIQWSDEDQIYIVSLPEWGDLIHTDGSTYEEAVKNGHELLEELIDARRQNNEPLPVPQVYATA